MPTHYPLILEPEQLGKNIDAEKTLIVDLRSADAYAAGHLPNALWLNYQSLLKGGETAPGLLPDADKLSSLFSSIGLSPEHHVVAYDQNAGAAASRLLWTLDILGHQSFSLLNGGHAAWVDGGNKISSDKVEVAACHYVAKVAKRGLVTKQQVLEKIDDNKVILLDARQPEEHSGALVRAIRGGHIPGSINLNWIETTNPAKHNRLRERAELERLLAAKGITRDKEIIPYCQTHHRSSHTYIMLKYMGFENVNAYAGSWSEWGNLPDVPITSFATLHLQRAGN
ncbi:MAG: sulfurtransferase [Arenicellales bacterium WSBS_2016_MAG_OTU3]